MFIWFQPFLRFYLEFRRLYDPKPASDVVSTLLEILHHYAVCQACREAVQAGVSTLLEILPGACSGGCLDCVAPAVSTLLEILPLMC